MDKRVFASCLLNNELAQAFHDLVAECWDHWDLTPYMVYLVDACDASLLPYLAEQFDIAGIKGFEMAGTEQQQRDIIKRSIELHKYIGTPWAVEQACAMAGFPIVSFDEGVTAPDKEPTSTDWAQFRVIIDAPTDREITRDQIQRLWIFVEYYKNARSHLVELRFVTKMSDDIITSEIGLDEAFGITPIGIPLRAIGIPLRVLPDGSLRITGMALAK